MKKEISAIINEHLPAQVAGEMKTFIESLEAIRTERDEAIKAHEGANVVLAEYRKKEAKYAGNEEEQRRLENWAAQLDGRQDELNKREDRIKVELMKQECELMQINMTNMQKLVEKVFGHPGVQISRSQQIPHRENGMSYTDWGSEEEKRQETKE